LITESQSLATCFFEKSDNREVGGITFDHRISIIPHLHLLLGEFLIIEREDED
jgi:hypothetical protein